MEAFALMSIHRGRDTKGQPQIVNPGEVFTVDGEELEHLVANNAVREATKEEIAISGVKKPSKKSAEAPAAATVAEPAPKTGKGKASKEAAPTGSESNQSGGTEGELEV